VPEESEPVDDDVSAVADAAEAVLVIDSAPLPLAVLLPNGRIALANRAFSVLLGYTPAELAGADLRLILADVSDFAARWDRVISAEGVTTDRVARLRRRDGVGVTARVASLVVTDDDGAPRFVLARALSTRKEEEKAG
jgi:PAS domain S-box-containing protein